MTQPGARPLLRLDVAELVLDDECQTRAALSQDAVDEYAEAYRAGAKMPPVRVFVVDGARVVIDGYHRVAAAVAAGQLQLTAEVVGTGTMDLARWTALRLNHAHGLRRTNADKRRAVELALRSPIGIDQSTRVVAEQVGVSQDLVQTIRQELETARQVPVPDHRVGKDGQLHAAHPRKPAKKANGSAGGVNATVTLSSLPLDGLLGPEAERADLERLNAGLAEAAKAIDAARRAVRKLGELREEASGIAGPPSRHRRLADRTLVEDVEEKLRALAGRLRGAVATLCPACEGQGCGTCGSRGWVYQRDRRTAALGA